MHTTEIVVSPAFQPSGRTRPSAGLRTSSAGRHASWTRFVMLVRRGRGAADVGRPDVVAPPRRELPVTFC